MRFLAPGQKAGLRRVAAASAGVLAMLILAFPGQALGAVAPGTGDPLMVDAAQHELFFAQNLAEGPFETCGLSFRRRIHEASSFDYQVSWGARFNCNVTMRYMKFRARLVRYQQDSHVLAYGNLINLGDVRNEFSGGNNQFLHRPHLVVYVSADLGFPVPTDPNNYAIGVVADPNSVNEGQSDCHRVGKTYVVHCEARSISFE